MDHYIIWETKCPVSTLTPQSTKMQTEGNPQHQHLGLEHAITLKPTGSSFDTGTLDNSQFFPYV